MCTSGHSHRQGQACSSAGNDSSGIGKPGLGPRTGLHPRSLAGSAHRGQPLARPPLGDCTAFRKTKNYCFTLFCRLIWKYK